MAGALKGIRILEAGLLVQGPQAAALLSDMGADVIKVELPGIGDQSRWIPISGSDLRSAYFTGCNRGKRSCAIDLRRPEGVGIFKTLAQQADIVISNFKPGTMDAWGLGYEALAAVNPKLIWAAGSSFGPLGADAIREGADLSGQAAGGIISKIGTDEGPPSPIGVTIADHIASLNLASGVLAALVARQQTGRGQRVEVSLLGGQIWAQASEYTHYLLSGEQRGRANFGHPLLRTLYGIFETRDDWIALVGVPLPAREGFFQLMGRPDLLQDPRLQVLVMPEATYREVYAELAAVFRTKTTDEWCAALAAIGIRHARVRNYRQVVDDPATWENGYFAEVEDGSGGTARVVGSPIRMSDTPLTPGSLAPELGAHTDEVLLEAGFKPDQIKLFRESGAI